MSAIVPGHQHPFLRQHRNPVAGGVQRVEVMRDQKDRQAERFLKRTDQIVELRRSDRIEARRRLIQKQDFGVQRQGAGEARAFSHPAGQLGRIEAPRTRRQADETDLQCSQRTPQIRGEARPFAQRHLDILCNGQGGKQRAVLEHHAPAPLDIPDLRRSSRATRPCPGRAPTPPRASAGRRWCAAVRTSPCQSRRRCPALRRAAGPGRGRRERRSFRSGSPARAPDHRLAVHHKPAAAKKIENSASTRITAKIA